MFGDSRYRTVAHNDFSQKTISATLQLRHFQRQGFMPNRHKHLFYKFIKILSESMHTISNHHLQQGLPQLSLHCTEVIHLCFLWARHFRPCTRETSALSPPISVLCINGDAAHSLFNPGFAIPCTEPAPQLWPAFHPFL